MELITLQMVYSFTFHKLKINDKSLVLEETNINKNSFGYYT